MTGVQTCALPICHVFPTPSQLSPPVDLDLREVITKTSTSRILVESCKLHIRFCMGLGHFHEIQSRSFIGHLGAIQLEGNHPCSMFNLFQTYHLTTRD